MTDCWIVADATFRDAARKKLLRAAVAAAVALLVIFGAAVHYQMEGFNARGTTSLLRDEAVTAMMMVSLYVFDLMAVVLTIMLSVDAVSGRIAIGAFHPIAMKLVPRWQVLIGTWLGLAAMSGAFAAVSFGGTIAVTHVMAGIVPANPIQGGLLVLLECLLVLTVTVMCSTWLSTLATGVIVLALHGVALVGGWLEQMSGVIGSVQPATVGIVASLIMPSESLWRRAAFEMQRPLAFSLQSSPFAGGPVPSAAMLRYAIFYLVTALFVALLLYQRRTDRY